MKLVDPTDDELNAAFATEVCGWHLGEGDSEYWIYWYGKDGKTVEHIGKPAPKFTKSADLVLPWLEKAFPEHPLHDHSFCIEIDWQPVHARYRPNYQWGYSVQIFPKHTGVVIGTAETLAKAAVIALLRAHNVEVEFA